MIDYKRFAIKSIDYLYKYITDNHLKSLILGISGGIDSTIVACLASIACKTAKIPLIGRSLPTTTNKIEESEIAQQVGNAFCSDFKTVNISDECEMIIHNMELTEGKMSNLQEGNIKARYRMIYLYNLASIHRGCVLDTDNKSEHELGFWTIHGDVGDLNCGLIYLWKTEVYELANYLANEASGLTQEQRIALKESIKLIPTDGNGVSSSDCKQFGLDNYEQVDDVLKTMYYGKTDIKNHPELLEAYNDLSKAGVHPEYIRLIDSYNEQGVDKVMLLHQNTAYKRKELPIKPTPEELGLC